MALELLKEELAFFGEKKDDLLRMHPGQFALINGRRMLGVFATREEAYAEGIQRFGEESFFVHRIVEKEPVEHVPLLAYSLRANF